MTRTRGLLSWVVIAGSLVLALPSFVRPDSGLADGCYLAGVVLLAVAGVAGARSLRPAERPVWLPWCAGLGCALAGSMAWQLGDRLALPWLTSAVPLFWMAFYVPITLTTVRIMRRRVPASRSRRTVLQDVAVVTAAATVFAWQVLIQPALAAGPASDRWTLFQVFFFPLGDVVLLALGLTLLLVPGHRSVAELLMLAALGTALIVDLVNVPAFSSSSMSSWYMAAYLVINATVAAAALHPSRAAATAPDPGATGTAGIRGWRTLMLGGALCSVGVGSTLTSRHGWQGAPAAAAMVVMVALILLRLHRAAAEAEAAHQRMRHEATHDLLTGVANRTQLFEDMRHAVTRSPTLFFVDLDGFKAVNDSRGHHCGDAVLKTVAHRLTGIVRHSDTVARLGGDEFVIVCTDLTPAATTMLAARIEQAIIEPIDTDTGPVSVGASIGITSMDRVTTDETLADALVTELLRAADAAMYEAKRDGGGTRQVGYVPVA
ncbi:diguanylate cyclase domain-containing protein [Actinoplanes sp. NPDC051494]|uniref:diguanylate cyclase domain-containing protein n=1 Tax=Actinoplanes sp. NPDC051494 TaxID=3363907 RepID=UPI0037A4583E